AAAVDGPIRPWGEWNHGLAAAGIADGRVVLPRAAVAGTLRHGSAAGTPLRHVEQAFLREEPLLAAREDERIAAVAAGQGSVLVHRALLPSRVKDPLQPVPRRPRKLRAG